MHDGRILVCVCGHGPPKVESKKTWCINNIKLIKDTCPDIYKDKIDFEIYCYDKFDTSDYQIDDNVKIITKTGVIGEFIYNDIKPDRVKRYDRLLLLLDDIELQDDFNLSDMISVQNKYNFDILSPCLTTDSAYSHNFMLYDDSYMKKTRQVNFLEFFFYMFDCTKKSYDVWYSLFTPETKWMWGMDYIINNIMKLKLGILNSMSMKHWYKNNKPTGLSASADSYARRELHNLCDKYNTNLSLIPKLNINIL